jgi:SAM-dependent methyltransferase
MESLDSFFTDKLKKIFTEKKYIIDIGGSLRIDPKNNRGKQTNWLDQYMKNVDYKVLDKIPDYQPDIVGDIHNLPLPDNSVDAIICMSVLEHVEEPQKAVKEMHRVLKPGGYCFIFVPFLFYYHPMKGYYGDFYRFTIDGVKYMARDFKTVEVENTRGAFATIMNLFPQFSKRTRFFNIIDRLFSKQKSNQTSGFNAFCIK